MTSFTFHYASTYTSAAPEPDEPCHTLHSTMLLLIQYDPIYFSNREVTLHSTMLLLIRRAVCRCDFAAFLYIPLCFYLYRQQSGTQHIRRFLYIPLCFYLYGQLPEADRAGVFLYIPLCFYLYRWPPSWECRLLSLHSTMLLLIRKRTVLLRV